MLGDVVGRLNVTEQAPAEFLWIARHRSGDKHLVFPDNWRGVGETGNLDLPQHVLAVLAVEGYRRLGFTARQAGGISATEGGPVLSLGEQRNQNKGEAFHLMEGSFRLKTVSPPRPGSLKETILSFSRVNWNVRPWAR